MSPAVFGLVALAVRVWAIVRVQPWLRAGVGAYAEVFAMGLAVALAGLTLPPATLGELAGAVAHAPSCLDGLDPHAPCDVDVVPGHVVRIVLVGEAVFGTILGLCLGLVSSAWVSVLASPLFSLDLLAGRTSAAFVTVLVTTASLLVFESGAHHAALDVLQQLVRAPGVHAVVTSADDGARLGRVFADAGLGIAQLGIADSVLGLVSLTLAATLAYTVSAGFPVLALDASRHALVTGVPVVAQASELLGAVLRPALLLLWLATALVALPSAWIDAFLASPWPPP